MEGNECGKLIQARDEVERHMRAYSKRAEIGLDAERKEQDLKKAEIFKLIYNETTMLIPNSTLFMDGKYYCPSCKVEVGAIYAAADNAGFPINFCPHCGQAFSGRIEWE